VRNWGVLARWSIAVETGDARPIKKIPYRIPYALKPVVEEHVDEMLKKRELLNQVLLLGVAVLC
jgi:hypothetical protein